MPTWLFLVILSWVLNSVYFCTTDVEVVSCGISVFCMR